MRDVESETDANTLGEFHLRLRAALVLKIPKLSLLLESRYWTA